MHPARIWLGTIFAHELADDLAAEGVGEWGSGGTGGAGSGTSFGVGSGVGTWAAPPPVSENSMLDTIVLSSHTVPHATQTASPAPKSFHSMSWLPVRCQYQTLAVAVAVAVGGGGGGSGGGGGKLVVVAAAAGVYCGGGKLVAVAAAAVALIELRS